MPAIVVPHAIAKGPGYLFRAILGTALPGQAKTVTLKALTSNVATITIGTHGIQVGDSITVALSPSDATLDGTWVVSAVTGTTVSYAVTAANISSVASAGTVTGPASTAGGTVAGSKFTDTWPVSWIPVGVTRDGSQFSYEVSTEDTIVAEYLDPLDTDETARNIGVAFDLAHITNRSYLMAFNGGTSTTVSGSAATTLTRVGPPVLGASAKTMLGWESQDGTQRTIFYQALQSGNIQWSNSKAPNFQSLPLTFKVTQPSSGDPFNIFLAGVDRLAAA